MPDGSHSVPDLQNYFEYIIKKHETITDENSPIKIYAINIKNRIVFKIKVGYVLQLLTKQTMDLLGSSIELILIDKHGELVPTIEVVDVFLIHFNVVDNTHQQKSKVLFSFVPDKPFGQLITVKPQTLIMLKTTSAESSFTENWFTDQDNKQLAIEDNVNMTLVVSESKTLI